MNDYNKAFDDYPPLPPASSYKSGCNAQLPAPCISAKYITPDALISENQKTLNNDKKLQIEIFLNNKDKITISI